MRTGENIRQRADGRYEARYVKGRDTHGRIQYGSCYGKTYEEAKTKRDALETPPVREMNLLILGAGAHGTSVQEIAQRLGVFRKIAFLDDDPAKEQAIGPCRDLQDYVREYPIAIPAVGDREIRMRWMRELARAGFVIPVLVDPAAAVSATAELGCAVVVEAGATVSPGVKIGSGCIISSGVTVARNVEIPAGTHINCGQVITQSIQEK